MSTYEKLIGDAIQDPTKQQRSMDRVECKLRASYQMFCKCGTVLDQRTIHVLYNIKLDKNDGACCKECSSMIEAYIQKNKVEAPFEWITWKGRKKINLTIEVN